MKCSLHLILALTCATCFSAQEVWLSASGTSGLGTGKIDDPYLVGTQATFDSRMSLLTSASEEGTVIYLKPGTYETLRTSSSWQLKKGQKLIGSGMSRTTLKRALSSADLMYTVVSASTATGVEICDLTIDANYAGEAVSCGGVNLQAGGSIRDALIKNVGGHGAHWPGHFMGINVTTPSSERTYLKNCEVIVASGVNVFGIRVSGGKAALQDNRVTVPVWASGHFETGAYNVKSISGMTFIGNYASGGYFGLYADSGVTRDLIISGNEIRDCLRGIELRRGSNDPNEVRDVLIQGNIITLSVAYNDIMGVALNCYPDSTQLIKNITVANNRVKLASTLPGGYTAYSLFRQGIQNVIVHDNVFHSPLQMAGSGTASTIVSSQNWTENGGAALGF